MYFDPLYIVLFIFILILSGGAQLLVKGAYAKYRKVGARANVSGAEAARRMLEHAGIRGVKITQSHQGELSDHYDPRDHTIRLSSDIYSGRSLASLGVACHEAGHAIQHARKFAPLMLRNNIVPLTNTGNSVGMIFIFIGMFLLMFEAVTLGQTLGIIGVIFFSFNFFFQLLNLIPEFDASRRANKELLAMGLVTQGSEARGVKTMLNAAALTYVAGTIVALLQLLYYLQFFLNRR